MLTIRHCIRDTADDLHTTSRRQADSGTSLGAIVQQGTPMAPGNYLTNQCGYTATMNSSFGLVLSDPGTGEMYWCVCVYI